MVSSWCSSSSPCSGQIGHPALGERLLHILRDLAGEIG
jgi:hypothetical protein